MTSGFYPNEWDIIACEIKVANNWRCQSCDRQCRRPGEFYLGWEYELTVAHLCQDYEGEAVNVAALCGPCHLAYDASHSWIARLRWHRWRQRQAGQLELAYS
jgi:hypothetical protein